MLHADKTHKVMFSSSYDKQAHISRLALEKGEFKKAGGSWQNLIVNLLFKCSSVKKEAGLLFAV
jgi:hypothetical protein